MFFYKFEVTETQFDVVLKVLHSTDTRGKIFSMKNYRRLFHQDLRFATN